MLFDLTLFFEVTSDERFNEQERQKRERKI